jgi:VanZ family protein
MLGNLWNKSPFLWLLRAVLLIAMLGVLYLALSPQQPVSLGGDKTNHVVAFVVMGTLAQLGFPRAGLLRVLLPLIVFGALIEGLQYVVGRFAGIDDLIADLIGLALSVIIAKLIMRL